ncbi:hypothetical protein WKW79_23670 [Variovorax robiniae]|uniref:Uncharacterized protein n=1 Tax=Variovorax robiniae TaxID=1836199 RepID=A0ABU8XCM1_9BURK
MKQSIELERRMEKERSFSVRGLNLAGFVFVIAVVVGVIVLRS